MTEKQKLAEALAWVNEGVLENLKFEHIPTYVIEIIRHALTPCEGAAMAAEVERLRGALKEIYGYVDCGRHGSIERIIKAALAGGKDG